ncbi:STAS domain-containing protein [Anaerococcus sp. Marseille-P9784]|uniref:STAS domain-containing protein n=1 Tax=Anaerococcus sp. Marseille-P9784 TaxID=2614127 RepID=UPI00124A50DC|nr:STAS domain-containing protein [Anaerococcus sp. Marseille-P9784]
MFDTKIENCENYQKISLTGDLDVYSEEEFKKFIDEKIDANKDIVFDLEKLDYLDSTGLGMFMTVYNMQKSKDKKVKIINSKENIKKLFKITDLFDLFAME